MSWLDTVKYVAKTVVKSINTVTGGPSVDLKGSFALPYKDRQRAFRSSESEDSDGEVAGAVRITTRARVTYELDRFQKNALLMFAQIKSELSTSGRVEEMTKQDLEAIADTFKGFRFEVITHIDLTCSEVDIKCQEFFQQDFSDYGAIVVVVLTYEGSTGELAALDGKFSESIILRHLTDDLNPTLLAKPKIYITEANRILSSGNRSSLPLEGHSDILGLHLPTTDHAAMVQRPLLLLCDNINRMADTNDFETILKKSVDDIQTKAASIFEDKPIELSANFTKEMILARSDRNSIHVS